MEDSWAIKMAEEVIKGKIKLKDSWCYENGVVLKALYRLYLKTEDRIYLDFCVNFVDKFINTDYSISDLDFENLSFEDYSMAEIAIDLYRETNSEKYLKIAEKFYEKANEIPKNSEEAFSKDNNIYIENFYFLQPFYAQAIKTFDSKLKLDEVIKQFLLGYKHLKNKEIGFLYQGYDENKTAEWADEKSGNSKCFWAKGLGVFSMALADSVEILTDKVYESKYLREMAKNISEAIIKHQDKQNGCWYQVLDCGERKGNYIEASASCMFLYLLAVCYKRNIICGKKVEKAISNAYNGIIDEFITITEKISINMNKNSVMASLKEKGDGSFAHYISLPIKTNDLVGISAFILAMNEYDKIKYKLRKQKLD